MGEQQHDHQPNADPNAADTEAAEAMRLAMGGSMESVMSGVVAQAIHANNDDHAIQAPNKEP